MGPQHAEALCIASGLKEVAKRTGPSVRVLVRSDSKWLVRVLRGFLKPRKSYIREAVRAIREAEKVFTDVDYRWVRSKQIRPSDKAASRGRTVAEKKEASRVAKRAERLAAAYVRAKEFQVEPRSDGTYSVAYRVGFARFVADLDNLTCTCASFAHRWADKGLAIRRKNMTPCAHLAAAAVHSGRVDMPWERYREPKQGGPS